MKSKILVVLVLALVATSLLWSTALAAGEPSPPEQRKKGLGSARRYICTSYTRKTSGSIRKGTRVSVYIPDKLKNGSKAPVMVFLHGFLMVAPQIYQDLINHTVYQGNIVICPQINPGGLFKMMRDTDQNVMMQRAVDNANRGLDMVRSLADLGEVVVCGHSLGGLLGACWMASGGIRPKALVLANPSTDATTGMPDFVSGLVNIKPIDWKGKAKAVDVPVMILTGNQDTIAPKSQAVALYDELANAPSRVVYCLRGDDHGSPDLMADHNAIMCDDGIVPSFLMNFAGGDAEVDATDYRYYWAAVDAAFAGRTGLRFRMGKWSDGKRVRRVRKLR